MSGRRWRAAVVGATGVVGQHLVARLCGHPWFELAAVAASERSAGRAYGDAAHWLLPGGVPEEAAGLPVVAWESLPAVEVVFSGMDARAAVAAEPALAASGPAVVSNASAHRLRPGVPLLVPEVNPEHLTLLAHRPAGRGVLVTNPNCCVAGLALALKPLADAFGVDSVRVTTLQAISGAGYPGVASLDILGNAIPFIADEEEKIARETAAILGRAVLAETVPAAMAISAQAFRVPVVAGHLLSVSARLGRRVTVREAREAMEEFRAPHCRQLPTAPSRPLVVADGAAPQPRLHGDAGGGMTVTVGRLRQCPVADVAFVALVHNTIRGAAGAALLNGELLAASGYLGGDHGAKSEHS